jgi:hypothetical protein
MNIALTAAIVFCSVSNFSAIIASYVLKAHDFKILNISASLPLNLIASFTSSTKFLAEDHSPLSYKAKTSHQNTLLSIPTIFFPFCRILFSNYKFAHPLILREDFLSLTVCWIVQSPTPQASAACWHLSALWTKQPPSVSYLKYQTH